MIDLTGKLVANDRRIRITTNMAIYWDRILVNTFQNAVPPETHTLPVSAADLSFGGYPLELRKKPEAYDYQMRSRTDAFRTHRGNYTRYGEVGSLLNAVDDKFVILASGDEVTAEFSAESLPPVRAGWKRTLFFYADGFEKPMETYTPCANIVGPLPFHGMTKYPYPAPERYPDSLDHVRYRLEFNTRRLTDDLPREPRFRRQ